MIKDIFYRLNEYIMGNKGKTFGGLIGFLIAILVLTIGFFKTLFIVFCTWIGYFFGSKVDNKEDLKKFFYHIFSLRRKT